MKHARRRVHTRRTSAAWLLGGLAIVLLSASATITSVSAAAPAQQTTTTSTAPTSTAPAQLPTTMNGSMPTTGSESTRLTGMAFSVILVGVGMCFMGEAARTRRRFRHLKAG